MSDKTALRETLAHFLDAGAKLTRAVGKEVKAAIDPEPTACSHPRISEIHSALGVPPRFCPICGKELPAPTVGLTND